MARKSFEERKAEYEERLYPVCKKLFARQGKGFEGTRKSEVTKETKISDKTIDKYSGGRSGLLTIVFGKGWADINTRVKETIEGEESFIEKIEAIIFTALKIFKKDQELRTIFLLEGRRTGEKGEDITMTNELLDFVALVDKILREGQEKGEIKKEVNLKALRSAIFGAVEGMLRDRLYYERIGFPASYSDKHILQISRILLEGFKV